jgi:capsular polysaccharide transport system permease protein
MKRSETSLSRSFEIQRRVIGALLMREILTRYGRHNIGFLWIFAEPMMFTLGITTMWTALKATHGSNLPIVPFAVTGYSTVLLWRNMSNRCCHTIEPNLSLLFHRNVRVLDLFAARVLLEIAGSTMSFVFISLVFITSGMMPAPDNLSTMLVGWVLLAYFSASLSLLVGSLAGDSETFQRIWHTIAYFLFPISGAVFMVDWLPDAVQPYALLVPMVNAVEMVREGYFGAGVKAHYSITYLFAVSSVMMLAGLLVARHLARKLEPA